MALYRSTQRPEITINWADSLTNGGSMMYQDPSGEAWVRVDNLSSLTEQVGGSHYKDYRIQPVQFFHENNVPFIEASVCKYVLRWRNKNGIEDLKKARHYLDMLIEMEENHGK